MITAHRHFSHFRFASLLALSAVACLPILKVSAETFEDRAQALLEATAEASLPVGGVGRQPYGTVVAKLALDPADADAIRFLSETTWGGGDWFFNALGNVRALYMASDHMTAAQLNSVAATASGHGNWFNTGTENHRLMSWSTGYLYAQIFPDRQWTWGGESISSTQLMENTKEVLRLLGRNRYLSGYSEFLSPNYEIYHITPMLNLYDYAEDPEVRAIAEAMLHYHFTNLSMASMEEFMMSPYSRKTEQDGNFQARVQSILWLYWGHGNPTLPFTDTWTIPQFAVSSWRPHSIVDSLGEDPTRHSYTARWQQAHFLSNARSERDPEAHADTFRYVVRTTHHNNGIALSSGVIRHIPSAFQLDDSMFNVAWAGTANLRRIEAFHPYWRGATEDDWRGPTSPFMQIGHYRNAAILLFDIPAEDPWAGVGRWADERAAGIRPLAQLRFPTPLAANIAEVDDWYFLRYGSYYIGIKTLRPGTQRDRRSLENYNVLKSRGTTGEHWSTGFIVEIGNEWQFGSFTAFQEATAENPVEIDWETMTASYTGNDGARIDITFNRSLEWPDGTIPEVSVDGVPIDYENWPVIESPWVHLDNHVFDLGSPLHGLTIDWSDDLPQFFARVNPDPYLGGREDEAGRWLSDPRYGAFYDHGAYPLLYHEAHGWQHITGAGLYWRIYDFALERWKWVDPSVYPFLYIFGDNSGWYEYLEGTVGERIFLNIENETTISEDQL